MAHLLIKYRGKCDDLISSIMDYVIFTLNEMTKDINYMLLKSVTSTALLGFKSIACSNVRCKPWLLAVHALPYN